MTFLLARIFSKSISTAIRCRKSPISWNRSIIIIIHAGANQRDISKNIQNISISHLQQFLMMNIEAIKDHLQIISLILEVHICVHCSPRLSTDQENDRHPLLTKIIRVVICSFLFYFLECHSDNSRSSQCWKIFSTCRNTFWFRISQSLQGSQHQQLLTFPQTRSGLLLESIGTWMVCLWTSDQLLWSFQNMQHIRRESSLVSWGGK